MTTTEHSFYQNASLGDVSPQNYCFWSTKDSYLKKLFFSLIIYVGDSFCENVKPSSSSSSFVSILKENVFLRLVIVCCLMDIILT